MRNNTNVTDGRYDLTNGSEPASAEPEFKLIEPRLFEVSIGGRIIGELHIIMPSGRYQPVSPWDYKTFENKFEAAEYLRGLR
jgi:hypothetical protein